MRETARHREAFEHYYSLGNKRALVSVTGVCGVSFKTIGRWSKEFQWKRRVVDRDKKIADALEKKADIKQIDRKARALATIDKMYKHNKDKLQSMPIEDVSDYIKLSTHEQLLTGEPTDRSEVNIALPADMNENKL